MDKLEELREALRHTIDATLLAFEHKQIDRKGAVNLIDSCFADFADTVVETVKDNTICLAKVT